MNRQEVITMIKERNKSADIVQVGGYDILLALKGHKCHCCLVAVLRFPWQRRKAEKLGLKTKPFGKLRDRWAHVVIFEKVRHLKEATRLAMYNAQAYRLERNGLRKG